MEDPERTRSAGRPDIGLSLALNGGHAGPGRMLFLSYLRLYQARQHN